MSKQEQRQKLFEEFEYKEKAGTAWSHNYLNQKPWHPLSYPNQRRKWIAEQMHGMAENRKSEVEKEFQKEQDFIKQSALMSKKQRQKVQAMQSVSFMYTKPPGYNAESARAAELADEERQKAGLEGPGEGGGGGRGDTAGTGGKAEGVDEALVLAKSGPMGGQSSAADGPAKKKRVPRDVFGNKIATEEDFEILKNAPRVETGIIGRAKPFGVEVRNVKCGRCGALGHQSGDRECPMRDAVTEDDAKRQQREDPLSLILVHNRTHELAWEPKQQLGGISPPRGGFRPDDPNQQILPPIEDEDDVGPVDQYGGFLAEDGAPDPALASVSQFVLESLTQKQRKELRRALKAKRKEERRRKRKKEKRKEEKEAHTSKGRRNDDSDSLSASSEEKREKKKRKGRKEKDPSGSSKRRKDDSEGFSSSAEEEEEEKRRERRVDRMGKMRRSVAKDRQRDETVSLSSEEDRRMGRARKQERWVDGASPSGSDQLAEENGLGGRKQTRREPDRDDRSSGDERNGFVNKAKARNDIGGVREPSPRLLPAERQRDKRTELKRH